MPFDSAEGMARWCRRVAVNRVTDDWRVRSRRIHAGPVEDRDGTDPEADATWRVMLAATVEAMGLLGEQERAAVISHLSGDSPSDERERAREALRRFRARERLRRIVGGLPVVVPWWRRLGRKVRWLGSQGRAAIGAAGSALVLSFALVVPHPVQQVDVTVTAPALQSADLPPAPTSRSGVSHGTRPAAGADQSERERPRPTLDGPRSRERPVATVPLPTGGDMEAGVAENHPERPLACVESEAMPMMCVPKPRALLDGAVVIKHS